MRLTWEAAKSGILFATYRLVPRKGKGPSMSAENENSENGGVETRDEGAVATSTDRLVDLYREMMLIRAFEEASQRGFRQGKIGGYLHVYTGQEAVATGFLQAFKEGDKVITGYRDHAHALLLGSDRSEEHTSELQSRQYLVCRLLLEKKTSAPHCAQGLI